MVVLFLYSVPQCYLRTNTGSTWFILYCSSLDLMDILSSKFQSQIYMIQDKTLVGIDITKIQNQYLFRPVTSNQVLTIPLVIIGYCISPTQIKNLFQ